MTPGHRVPGGLVLPSVDTRPADLAIRAMPPPARLFVPLSQHRGVPALPIVGDGDRVVAGQCIAEADGLISVAVHSPVAGRVASIAPHPGPDGHRTTCIVIDVDPVEAPVRADNPAQDTSRRRPLELRRAIADAGIAGLGGAAFPTAVKLAAQADTRLHTLIINGAECDPGIACDDALMQSAAHDIVRGTILMLAALDIHRAVFAVKADKPRSLAAMRDAVARQDDDRLSLAEVPARYPIGGERQLIQYLSGREVPMDGLPIDVGFLCHNVATARAVELALDRGRPLISRVVSVLGDAVETPTIVDVPIGTPIADVIAFCGGYRQSPRRIVIGGRMMGRAIADDTVPVTKAVNAIEVSAALPAAARQTRPCIRCGECALVCPASLQPQQMHWHASAQQLDELLSHRLVACIECGCCDTVCPSHIPLTGQFRDAKRALAERDQSRLAARHAQLRYERRNERLAEQQRQRAERRAKRQARAANSPVSTRKKDILDAVARARRARKEREQSRDA